MLRVDRPDARLRTDIATSNFMVLRRPVESALYPTVFLSGLVAGLWLDAILKSGRGTNNPVPVRKDSRIPSIAAQMRYAKGIFANAKEGTEDRFTRVDMRTLSDARHKFRATEVSLQKLGLKTPWLDYEVDPLRFILTNLEYIEKVEPLLSAGHVKEAKGQAEIIVGKLPPNFVDQARL